MMFTNQLKTPILSQCNIILNIFLIQYNNQYYIINLNQTIYFILFWTLLISFKLYFYIIYKIYIIIPNFFNDSFYVEIFIYLYFERVFKVFNNEFWILIRLDYVV